MFDEMFCHPPSCIWTRPRSEKAAVATMCSGGSSCANLSIVPYERRIYLWWSGPMRVQTLEPFTAPGVWSSLCGRCSIVCMSKHMMANEDPVIFSCKKKAGRNDLGLSIFAGHCGGGMGSAVGFSGQQRLPSSPPRSCCRFSLWHYSKISAGLPQRMQETKEQTRPPHGDDNVSLRRCDGDKKRKHSTYACAFCVPHGQTYQISLTIIASFVTLHIRKDQGSRNPRHLTKPTCLLYRMVQRWTIAGTGSQQHRWVERRTGWKGKQQKASN
ncbi:hypothetical protein BHM03_00036790 [Ensete ventricosum]|nr:hypothetical protein BHM03_00036790 [Ensete ventricosum]